MSNGDENNQQHYRGPEIGQKLERARTEKGLSLKDVERDTKIRARYLEGLEQEDFTVLPDAVYVQGFLKTYANYLGLDGERLANDFRSHRSPRRSRKDEAYKQPIRDRKEREGGFDRPLLSPGGLEGTERRRISGTTIFTIALALVILVSVVGTLYWIGRGAQPGGDAGENNANVSAPAQRGEEGRQQAEAPAGGEEEGQNGAASEANAATSETFQVNVTVEGAESWLEVNADGEPVLAQNAPPGFAQSFEAREEVSITAGNAGAVSVSVNEQDLGPMGESGEVLTRTYEHKPGN
jgi:cytoskeleton protein RodZ